MKFNVSLMPSASADSDYIYLWLARRSPRGAAAWHEAFLNALEQLANNPYRFERTLESRFTGEAVRSMSSCQSRVRTIFWFLR